MKLSSSEMAYIKELSEQSRVLAIKSFEVDNVIAYLVKPEDVSKAIGKSGANVKSLSQKLNKKVEIYEDAEDIQSFLEKALRGATIKNLEIQENGTEKNVSFGMDSESKANLLNNSKKIRVLKTIIEDKYKIKNMKIK